MYFVFLHALFCPEASRGCDSVHMAASPSMCQHWALCLSTTASDTHSILCSMWNKVLSKSCPGKELWKLGMTNPVLSHCSEECQLISYLRKAFWQYNQIFFHRFWPGNLLTIDSKNFIRYEQNLKIEKKRVDFSVIEIRNKFLSTVVIHLHKRNAVQRIWENACSTLPTRQKHISTYDPHAHSLYVIVCTHWSRVHCCIQHDHMCAHFCGLHCQDGSTFWGSRVCVRAWASAEPKCTEKPERRRHHMLSHCGNLSGGYGSLIKL